MRWNSVGLLIKILKVFYFFLDYKLMLGYKLVNLLLWKIIIGLVRLLE